MENLNISALENKAQKLQLFFIQLESTLNLLLQKSFSAYTVKLISKFSQYGSLPHLTLYVFYQRAKEHTQLLAMDDVTNKEITYVSYYSQT